MLAGDLFSQILRSFPLEISTEWISFYASPLPTSTGSSASFSVFLDGSAKSTLMRDPRTCNIGRRSGVWEVAIVEIRYLSQHKTTYYALRKTGQSYADITTHLLPIESCSSLIGRILGAEQSIPAALALQNSNNDLSSSFLRRIWLLTLRSCCPPEI